MHQRFVIGQRIPLSLLVLVFLASCAALPPPRPTSTPSSVPRALPTNILLPPSSFATPSMYKVKDITAY